MIPAHWHPLARQELFEASDFYEDESPGLGDSFLDVVVQAVREIRSHPRAGRVVLRRTRRFLIRRFPYSVVYKTEENSLFILAVAHHKRHPRYWAGRL